MKQQFRQFLKKKREKYQSELFFGIPALIALFWLFSDDLS
jgi:hypothetical protein